jgi:hypothetical protein
MGGGRSGSGGSSDLRNRRGNNRNNSGPLSQLRRFGKARGHGESADARRNYASAPTESDDSDDSVASGVRRPGHSIPLSAGLGSQLPSFLVKSERLEMRDADPRLGLRPSWACVGLLRRTPASDSCAGLVRLSIRPPPGR